jgi:Tfp pilus assembly protein FimT
VVEIMIVVLIMSIIGVMSLGAVADFEANQRADRAAREAMALFRYARNLAMTTGKNAKVRVVSSSSGMALGVYHKNYGTNKDTYDYTQPYGTSLTASRTLVLNMNASRELVGTAISPAGTNDFEFNVLGSCTPAGTLTFSYGGRSQTLTVRSVGDPVIP